MAATKSTTNIMDREFLELRARILELAASFDRMDRAQLPSDEPRLERLRQGLQILLSDAPNRAEQVQLLFSRTYDENWRQTFGL